MRIIRNFGYFLNQVNIARSAHPAASIQLDRQRKTTLYRSGENHCGCGASI